MHELAIATALVEQLEEILKKEGHPRLLAFTLELGEWSGIEKDALEFALPLVLENSSFPGAKVIIKKIPVEIFCQHCRRSAPLDDQYVLKCPFCGSEEVLLAKGKNFIIKALEIEDREEATCV
jgi:hydrogenase nickel incorporation protein HypA/HybF